MNGMFLNADEVQQLTDRVQHGAQAVVLRGMGIEHKIRPDGSIAILRQHVEQEFGIRAGKKDRVTIPNWEALQRAKTA